VKEQKHSGIPKVLVLFSGGRDSSAAAVCCLREGYRTHLVTFDNGAERGLDNSRRKADLIKKRFGKMCSWKLMSSRVLFHAVAVKNLEDDVKKYGNLLCCGCKLAMLSEAIIYCRKNNINRIADGFEKGQTYYPEQTPAYMDAADAFAGKFGITYSHPVYRLSARKIKEIAVKAGISAAPLQAECLFGLNRVHNKNIKKYMLEKLPAAGRYIGKTLRRKRRPGREKGD